MRFRPIIKEQIAPLLSLIAQGEGVQLDFKQLISDQRKIARTLAAFANNRGGRLLVGVKDNGRLLGCDTEQEMYMIAEAAEHYCEPPVDISFTIYETEEALQILEAEVKNSLRKPHFAQDDHGDWKLYMRVRDKTMVASKATAKMLDAEWDEMEKEDIKDSKERYVLEALQRKETLTAKELSKALNISLQRANSLLVKLTKSGYILHHKDGRGYYYMLR